MRTGLHANDTRDHAKILDYYRRSRANVFKTLVYQDSLLDALKQLDVTIIGRIHFDQQPLGGSAARNNITHIVDSARRHPSVLYWEGYNESYQGPRAGTSGTEQDEERRAMARYAEWEIERMQALEAIGKKAVIGNFSTGTPDLATDAWSVFRPALEHAASRGHALGLHEYAGPYMQYMCETPDGKNQWRSGQFNGVSAQGIDAPGLEGWLTLRYRKVYRLLRTWNLGSLPLFVTEGGIDDTTPRPGPGGKGYKAFRRDGWDRIPGIGDYADQRRWYMGQVTRDAYVAGIVDFGWDGSHLGWPDFDLSTDPAMVNRIIAREADLPRLHEGAPPPPPPPPPVNLADILVAEAARRQCIRINPRATLLQAMVRDGLMPTSDEFPVSANGVDYVAQRAERPGGGARVYYVVRGQWDRVQSVEVP